MIREVFCVFNMEKLFPLERQTLISRDNAHYKCGFRPNIPHISRFTESLYEFCSHFVATAIVATSAG